MEKVWYNISVKGARVVQKPKSTMEEQKLPLEKILKKFSKTP